MPADPKWTPAPWTVIRNERTLKIVASAKNVATIELNRYTDNDRNEVNARVIAAAPAIAETLIALLAALAHDEVQAINDDEIADEMENARILLRYIETGEAQ